VAFHADYIRRIDSFQSSGRPPVWHLIDDFFIRPYGAALLNNVITAFVVIGITFAFWRHRRALAWLAGAFLPFAISALFGLDMFGVNRLSLSYLPGFAILAAVGFATSGVLLRARLALGCLLLIALGVRVYPAVVVLNRTMSPPVAACMWIRSHADPGEAIVVGPTMMKIAELLLPEYPRITSGIDAQPGARFEIREGRLAQEQGVVFERQRDPLEKMVRRRYFEVSVIDLRRP
jgi:hypothetical protein